MHLSAINPVLVDAAAFIHAFGGGLPRGKDDPAANASDPPVGRTAGVDEDEAPRHLLPCESPALAG